MSETTPETEPQPEEAPSHEEPPKRQRAKRKPGARRKSPSGGATGGTRRVGVSFEQQLAEAYSSTTGLLYFVDADVAEWSAKNIEVVAHAHAAWARENAHVKRFLETIVTGGVAGQALITTAVWGVGCFAIVQAKQSTISPGLLAAGQRIGALGDVVVVAPNPNGDTPNVEPQP